MRKKSNKTKYRSGFEARYGAYLKDQGIKARHEPFKLPYTLEQNYIPDFVTDDGLIIETKGLFDSTDRAKMIAVKKKHPHLRIKIVFMRDDYLTKAKSGRYSDWCKKHGFEYEIVGDLKDLVDLKPRL